jgi:hypothetical protein
LGNWTKRQIRDSIKPNKAIKKVKRVPDNFATYTKLSSQEFKAIQTRAFPLTSTAMKLAAGNKKNDIILYYSESSQKQKSSIQHQVATVKKDETPSMVPYPPHHQLVTNCKMRLSLDLQYRVRDLSFDNIVIFIVKWHKLYISKEVLVNLMSVN